MAGLRSGGAGVDEVVVGTVAHPDNILVGRAPEAGRTTGAAAFRAPCARFPGSPSRLKVD
jgi:hypothetical protein